MSNQILLSDSIDIAKQIIYFSPLPTPASTLEQVCMIATIIIAILNVGIVVYIFLKNYNKDNDNNESNRKISLLKTLVLDYNMMFFYQFFDEISIETDKLKRPNVSLETKNNINKNLNDVIATKLRQRFTDTLLAINRSLYIDVLAETDLLIDSFTESIFDDGVNLSHVPKFEELISKKISESKTKIIKILFDYKGD